MKEKMAKSPRRWTFIDLWDHFQTYAERALILR